MAISQKATEWERGSTFHEMGENKRKTRVNREKNNSCEWGCNSDLQLRCSWVTPLNVWGTFCVTAERKNGPSSKRAEKADPRGERREKSWARGLTEKGEESGGERIVTGKNKDTHAHTVCPWVTRTHDSSCIQRTWSERSEKVLSSWTLINAHFFCDRLFDVNMTSPAPFALSNLRGLFTWFFFSVSKLFFITSSQRNS